MLFFFKRKQQKLGKTTIWTNTDLDLAWYELNDPGNCLNMICEGTYPCIQDQFTPLTSYSSLRGPYGRQI